MQFRLISWGWIQYQAGWYFVDWLNSQHNRNLNRTYMESEKPQTKRNQILKLSIFGIFSHEICQALVVGEQENEDMERIDHKITVSSKKKIDLPSNSSVLHKCNLSISWTQNDFQALQNVLRYIRLWAFQVWYGMGQKLSERVRMNIFFPVEIQWMHDPNVSNWIIISRIQNNVTRAERPRCVQPWQPCNRLNLLEKTIYSWV